MVAEDAVPARRGTPARRRWGRARRGAADLDALSTGRRIAAVLRGGLAGRGVTAAARALRGLIDADAIGLGGLHGAMTWVGRPVDAGAAGRLAERALAVDSRAAAGELVAVPLHARGELAGV